jgi:hypothetical protein
MEFHFRKHKFAVILTLPTHGYGINFVIGKLKVEDSGG